MIRKPAEEEAAQTWPISDEKLRRKLAIPSQGRLYYIRYAFKLGYTIDQIFQLTKIDPWFLAQMKELVDFEPRLLLAAREEKPSMDYIALIRQAKEWGYSDVQLATIMGTTPAAIRDFRQSVGIRPVYKLVDTCAAEFEAATPYYYSAYERPFADPDAQPDGTVFRRALNALDDARSALATAGLRPDSGSREVLLPENWIAAGTSADEIRVSQKKKIIILGGGPNRIGQGIEFDYCCVQAAFAAKELGFESVMVNSNPETVSTDYDTSDLLFFEPLTHEDVLNIVERLNGQPLRAAGDNRASGGNPRPTGDQSQAEGTNENAAPSAAGSHPRLSNDPLTALTANPNGLVAGVIVQFGGQTPLNLARGPQRRRRPHHRHLRRIHRSRRRPRTLQQNDQKTRP